MQPRALFYPITNSLSKQLAGQLVTKMALLLQQLKNTNKRVKYFDGEYFNWDTIRNGDKKVVVLTTRDNVSFMWNRQFGKNLQVFINIHDFDVSKGTALDGFVEVEQKCFEELQDLIDKLPKTKDVAERALALVEKRKEEYDHQIG